MIPPDPRRVDHREAIPNDACETMVESPELLEADLILVHAPSVYDFRERDDLILPFLGESGSVNVTPVFEQYPLGFLSLRTHLALRGLRVEIVNLASLMLRYPRLSVRRLLTRLRSPVFGLDLHWLCHAHGVKAVSGLIKEIHGEALVICGGISATYFVEELVRWPGVDAVVRGYDTLAPVASLVERRAGGLEDLSGIPNVVWKDAAGTTRDNGFDHRPDSDFSDVSVSWDFYSAESSPLTARSIQTLPSTGCGFDCPWCGGSRYAMDRVMKAPRPLVQKDIARIEEELRTLGPQATQTGIYALQCYSEGPARLSRFLEAVSEFGIASVHFEQFHLPGEATMERMARATRAYLVLSPESHDPMVSKLAGRGTYTMDELEQWIPRALSSGIQGIFIWYFVGMPRQDVASVMETVEAGTRLMEKFPGGRVVPLICPMAPFLDPGSRFFEEPEQHGYRIHRRSLEEHRAALVEPVWHMRMNYETSWLTRKDIQDTSFRAIRALLLRKADHGVLPGAVVNRAAETIDETTALFQEVESEWTCSGQVGSELRSRIRRYNVLTLGSSHDQILPMKRPLEGRWFDDYSIPVAWAEDLCS